MMTKNFKKVTALALSAAMIASMAACGGSEKPATTTPATTTPAANSGSTTAAPESTPAKAERPTITFQTIDFEGSPLSGNHADEVIAYMEDYTNTHVEFTWIANDVLEEKVSLALANPKEMPQIMAVGGVTGAIISAAEAGAFVDLNNYIYDAAKYPNLSQANKNVNEALTVGGQLIGVYRARDIGRYGMGYRADWAEKLGIDTPKTVDDVYDMMYQFTNNDPDGDGQKDTFGLALCKYTGPFDIMQTWFGVGNGWAEVDGKLVPVHMQPEYKEALDWFKKMYDEGLVYQDWAVRDTATWQDSVKNGECGIFIDVLDGSRRIWDYFVNNNIPAVEGTSEELASMALVGTINDKTLATSGFNGFFAISASTANTDEKVEACLHFLDKMCDDEMIILSSYGLEGIHWKLDDKGFLVDLDSDDPVSAKAYAAMNQTVAYIPNTIATSPTVETTERTLLERQVKASNIDYAVFNPASSFLINSSEYSMNGATLDQVLADARTQYICGEIDEAGLQAAWAQWLSQGGQKIMDEVNAQYSANK